MMLFSCGKVENFAGNEENPGYPAITIVFETLEKTMRKDNQHFLIFLPCLQNGSSTAIWN